MGITLLGPIGVDGSETRLSRRDKVVLCLLAMQPGQAVSRDRMGDVLWGDHPPVSAAKILQGCVVRLRKVLGAGAIETSAGGYRLMVPLDDIDARRFERGVDRARRLLAGGQSERAAAVLTEVLALWRGVPLEELDGWNLARIESGRLTELRLEAEELYVAAGLGCGQHARVLARARAMVVETPLRERRWGLLASAHYQAGRQGDALLAIRGARRVLAAELGLDPGPELEELERAILRHDPALVAPIVPPEPTSQCPYPGLLAYDVEDASIFFGRDVDVTACLRRLRDTDVLAVVGASGSGKSSLVRAGVAASLTRDGFRVEVISPGSHPMDELPSGPSSSRGVLLVDQCEEVFTLCRDPSEREQFLSSLVRRAQGGKLIVALRADFLADVSAHPGFARIVERGLYLVGALDEPALRAVVEAPAHQAALVVEPGLVDLLVREVVDQPGALPLLSHALQETWERREGRTLTVEGYRDSGGIRGAVAKSAERVYTSVGPVQQAALRDLLLRLLVPGDDDEPVRTKVPRRRLAADEDHDDMIELLVTARLVTSDDGVVQLAHEALGRAWPRLRGWLDQDLDGQRLLHHLALAAEAWDALGRPDSEVYRGVRLATALEWRHTTGHTLTEVERAYLDRAESIAEADRVAASEQARLQARTNRRLRGLLGVAAVLVAATVAAALVATGQAEQAGAARREALHSRDLAAAAALTADSRGLGAKALTTRDISLSMLLAVQAVLLEDSPESRANLAAVLAKRLQLAGTSIGRGPEFIRTNVQPRVEADEPSGAKGARFGSLAGASSKSPAFFGSRWFLATSNGTNRVLFYEGSGEFLGEHQLGEHHARGHDVSVAFRPGSFTLAAGMNTPAPQPLKLLDAVTRDLVDDQLSGFPTRLARVVDIDFSEDGRHLAGTFESARRGDRFALVWDLRRRSDPHYLPLPRAPSGLALSPDGETLYTSWPLAAHDVSSGRRLWRSRLRGADHLDIDPSGALLAMPEWDDAANSNVVLVRSRTGTLQRRLIGHREQTRAVRFSPNGAEVASLSDDETVLVWDVRRGTIIERLQTGQVNAITFSPRGDKLVTAGEDGALRTWDLTGEARYIPSIGTAPYLPTRGAVMDPSPDGRALAYSWSPDDGAPRRLQFHDVVTDTSEPATVGGLVEPVTAGSWSADRRHYVTGHQEGLIRVWAPGSRGVVERRVGPSRVTALDHTSDGRRLVISESTGVVRRVDARTLRRAGPPVDLHRTACCVVAGARPGTAFVFSDPSSGGGRDTSAYTRWHLVDLDTGSVLRSRLLGLLVEHAAISPDGDHLAVIGVEGDLSLLDARTGAPTRPPVDGHDAAGHRVAYSDDGRLVASTAVDGTVSLWDGRTGDLLGTVDLADRAPLVAEFLYGDEQLLIASESGGIYRWDTSRYWAVSFACRLAGRTLTRVEWRDFLGDRPFDPTCPTGPSSLPSPIP